MKLTAQRRLASAILKCSEKRVRFDSERLEEIKEAITKADIRSLIKDKAVYAVPKKGISRVRANKIRIQKVKGKRRGLGSRKGKKTSRTPKKKEWMNKIRKQKELLKKMRDNKVVSTKVYRDLYLKAKGGFFRSIRHIKLYVNERNLVNDKDKK